MDGQTGRAIGRTIQEEGDRQQTGAGNADNARTVHDAAAPDKPADEGKAENGADNPIDNADIAGQCWLADEITNPP
jgi:hypothetical protein